MTFLTLELFIYCLSSYFTTGYDEGRCFLKIYEEYVWQRIGEKNGNPYFVFFPWNNQRAIHLEMATTCLRLLSCTIVKAPV